jgi:hypothetical protein
VQGHSEHTKVRPPAVAGQFYSADLRRLRSDIMELLAKVPASDSAPAKALIAPHCRLRLFRSSCSDRVGVPPRNCADDQACHFDRTGALCATQGDCGWRRLSSLSAAHAKQTVPMTSALANRRLRRFSARSFGRCSLIGISQDARHRIEARHQHHSHHAQAEHRRCARQGLVRRELITEIKGAAPLSVWPDAPSP